VNIKIFTSEKSWFFNLYLPIPLSKISISKPTEIDIADHVNICSKLPSFIFAYKKAERILLSSFLLNFLLLKYFYISMLLS